MATIDIPYFREKPGRGGVKRYFWEPSKALLAAGFEHQRIPAPAIREALAGDAAALKAAAITAAETLNAGVEAWKKGAAPAPATVKQPLARTALIPGSVAAGIALYKASDKWTGKHRRPLAESTKVVYGQALATILEWATVTIEGTREPGNMPLRAITPPRVQALYQALSARSLSQANTVVSMLRTFLAFCRREGLVAANAAEKPDMTGLEFSGRVWPPAAIALFVRVADLVGRSSIGTAVMLNEWLGQREDDVLSRSRSLLRQGRLFVRQSKTGAGVVLPIGMVETLTARLAAEIAAQDQVRGVPLDPATRPLILCEMTGERWNGHTFRHEFARIRDICAALCPSFEVDYLPAGRDEPVVTMAELQFKHLRHTAVVRLAEAQCTDGLITSITGHTLESVKRILEHYLVRTGEMAKEAFALRMAKEKRDA